MAGHAGGRERRREWRSITEGNSCNTPGEWTPLSALVIACSSRPGLPMPAVAAVIADGHGGLSPIGKRSSSQLLPARLAAVGE